MNRTDVENQLRRVCEAREAWHHGHASFTVHVDNIMRRLIHEAAVNYMSAEDVARLSGVTVKRVRQLMRTYDLDPKQGKRLLSAKAAEALANNAVLLGIEPSEMDLMSPLAYLPAGSELRKAMAAQQASQVHEVSENAFLDRVADAFYNSTPFPETPVVTVRMDDLNAVLDATDYVNNRSLIGPVDRMGDAIALVNLRAANEAGAHEVSQVDPDEFLETVHRCTSFVPYRGSDNEFWCEDGQHIIESSVMLQYREKYL